VTADVFDAAWVENVPAELRALRQWVCWQAEPRDGRITKVPVQVNGRRASSTDPATWDCFSVCVEGALRHNYQGVGFVFTADDPYCGVDLDACRDPATGAWDGTLGPFLCALRSYTEVSVSGRGFHISVRATLPSGAVHRWHPCGPEGAHLEIYDRGRYFTMTGRSLGGFPREVGDRQALVCDGVLPLITPAPKTAVLHRAGRVPAWNVETVLRHALGAANGGKLRALWTGGACGYGSESEADLAFCALVAFWTADAAVVDAAFRQSGRMREKWDEQRGEQTYGAITVTTALTEARHFTTREARAE
jgi:putative DNA primase/helicase